MPFLSMVFPPIPCEAGWPTVQYKARLPCVRQGHRVVTPSRRASPPSVKIAVPLVLPPTVINALSRDRPGAADGAILPRRRQIIQVAANPSFSRSLAVAIRRAARPSPGCSEIAGASLDPGRNVKAKSARTHSARMVRTSGARREFPADAQLPNEARGDVHKRL